MKKDCLHKLKHTTRLIDNPEEAKKGEKVKFIIEKICADCGYYLGQVVVWYEDDAEPSQNDLIPSTRDEMIAFFAFRYALGRKTYAVSTVVDYLLENWNLISTDGKKIISQEIQEAIVDKKAGMDMDIKEWSKIISRYNIDK